MDDNNEKVTAWGSWIVFGGLMMIFTGIINFFYGLAAIFNANWYVYAHGTAYLLDVSTWGWWMLLVGVVLGISGGLLMVGNMFGRVVGVIAAVLSLLFNVAVFAVTPVWSSIAIVVNAVVIYAILAHGGEMKTLRAAHR